MVELVELSKIPMIVGSKRFFREVRSWPLRSLKRVRWILWGYLKSYGSGMQDLHESGRHSEDEEGGTIRWSWIEDSRWREQHGGWWDHHRFKGKVENCWICLEISVTRSQKNLCWIFLHLWCFEDFLEKKKYFLGRYFDLDLFYFKTDLLLIFWHIFFYK